MGEAAKSEVSFVYVLENHRMNYFKNVLLMRGRDFDVLDERLSMNQFFQKLSIFAIARL